MPLKELKADRLNKVVEINPRPASSLWRQFGRAFHAQPRWPAAVADFGR